MQLSANSVVQSGTASSPASNWIDGEWLDSGEHPDSIDAGVVHPP